MSNVDRERFEFRCTLQTLLGVSWCVDGPPESPLEAGVTPLPEGDMHSLDLIDSEGVMQRLMFTPAEFNRLVTNGIL
jgi:hypothetical protein